MVNKHEYINVINIVKWYNVILNMHM